MLTGDNISAYKINIDGTYTEAVGVNLTGTITGATWLGERTISFEFDENDSNANFNYAIFLHPVATVSITKD